MEETDLKIDHDAAGNYWYAKDASGREVATDPTYVGLIAKLNAMKSQARKP